MAELFSYEFITPQIEPMYFGAPYGGYFGGDPIEITLDPTTLSCTVTLAALDLDTQPPNLVDLAPATLSCTVALGAVALDTYALEEIALDVQPMGTTATLTVALTTQAPEVSLDVQPMATTAIMGAIDLSTFALVEITLDVQPMGTTATLSVSLRTNNEPVFFTVEASVKSFQSSARARAFQSKAEVKN